MNPKIMYWTLTQVTLKLKKKKLYTKTMKNNHSHFLVQRNFKVVKMIQLQIFKLANIK